MTRLLLDPAADLSGAVGPVTLVATLFDPDPVRVAAFTVLDASSVIDLPAPKASEAWRLTVRQAGRILDERTVHWAGSSPIAWANLTDLDPDTLTVPPGSPLLDVSLDELRQTILGGASAAYDTLKELEDALAQGTIGADVINALAGKEPLGLSDATKATFGDVLRRDPNVNLQGRVIYDLGNPTAADHAATKGYVDGLANITTAVSDANVAPDGYVVIQFGGGNRPGGAQGTLILHTMTFSGWGKTYRNQRATREDTGQEWFRYFWDTDWTIWQDAPVRHSSGPTESRPNAATVGAGAEWYDATLKRPIWSDGAVWRDAAGTAV